MPQRPGIRYGGVEGVFSAVDGHRFTCRGAKRVHLFRGAFYAAPCFMNCDPLDRATEDRLESEVVDGRDTVRECRHTAREELVAEMGAAFLCAMAGIEDPTIQNSASYIHSWLRFLKSDPKASESSPAPRRKRRVTSSWDGLESEQVEARRRNGGGSGLN